MIPCKGSPKYQLSATPPVYSLVIDQVEEKDAGLYECKVTSVFSENEASGTVELILGNGELIYRIVCIICPPPLQLEALVRTLI